EEIPPPDGLGVYACMLGGDDGRTLMACAAPDFLEHNRATAREAVLLTTTGEPPHAGLPRPPAGPAGQRPGQAPAPGLGVDGRRGCAEGHTQHAAHAGQQHRLDHELQADVAAGRPRPPPPPHAPPRPPPLARRSSPEMTMTLAIPTPPTTSATAPRPSSSAVRVSSAWALAAKASLGRDTSTSLGDSGLAVAASTAHTSSVWSGSVRTRTVD